MNVLFFFGGSGKGGGELLCGNFFRFFAGDHRPVTQDPLHFQTSSNPQPQMPYTQQTDTNHTHTLFDHTPPPPTKQTQSWTTLFSMLFIKLFFTF